MILEIVFKYSNNDKVKKPTKLLTAHKYIVLAPWPVFSNFEQKGARSSYQKQVYLNQSMLYFFVANRAAPELNDRNRSGT